MNTRAANTVCGARQRGESGFTMAEIAISLGVIAFALIAIIGILPSGLQVQRDNREETIINQDARLLLHTIQTGGRDGVSDLGLFVEQTNGVRTVGGIPTTAAIDLLSDPDRNNVLVFSAISGGIASRGSDLGFKYQVVNAVTNSAGADLVGGANEFAGTRLTNQVHEVRLRFSWPLKPLRPDGLGGTPGPEANRYIARTLISGWHTNRVMHAQEFYQPQ